MPPDGDSAECGRIDAASASVCNPLGPIGAQGCNLGERCTWIRVSPTCGGQLGCAPAGVVPVGGSCTWGAFGSATGHDDCVAGTICDTASLDVQDASGTCEAMCSLATAELPCSVAFGCGARDELFRNSLEQVPLAGVCEPLCDPLSQVRLSDGAPACGSTTMPADLGCYGFPSDSAAPTDFRCYSAGTGGHGTVPTPPFQVNSCAPGAIPMGDRVCTAYCAPLRINNTTPPANIVGEPPFSCPEVGATGPGERCLHLWWLEGAQTPLSAASNAVGFCFDFTRYNWDDDQNPATPPVPWPLPETTTPYVDPLNPQPTEDLFWGAAPYPTPFAAERRSRPDFGIDFEPLESRR